MEFVNCYQRARLYVSLLQNGVLLGILDSEVDQFEELGYRVGIHAAILAFTCLYFYSKRGPLLLVLVIVRYIITPSVFHVDLWADSLGQS